MLIDKDFIAIASIRYSSTINIGGIYMYLQGLNLEISIIDPKTI
ncbi:MAG: hypothetical protein QW552_07785 [Ignisphaera sp.]